MHLIAEKSDKCDIIFRRNKYMRKRAAEQIMQQHFDGMRREEAERE